jgi:hypothetical protein
MNRPEMRWCAGRAMVFAFRPTSLEQPMRVVDAGGTHRAERKLLLLK